MDSIKRFLHHAAVAVGRILAKLLPDRVPVTFVGAESVRESQQLLW